MFQVLKLSAFQKDEIYLLDNLSHWFPMWSECILYSVQDIGVGEENVFCAVNKYNLKNKI